MRVFVSTAVTTFVFVLALAADANASPITNIVLTLDATGSGAPAANQLGTTVNAFILSDNASTDLSGSEKS